MTLLEERLNDWIRNSNAEQRDNLRAELKDLRDRDYLRQWSVRHPGSISRLEDILKEDRPLEGKVKDGAMMSEDVGGIDFQRSRLDLEVTGEEQDIKFDIPPFEPYDVQQLESGQFQGLSPVILQIIPVNVPMILGIKESEAKERLSMIQN